MTSQPPVSVSYVHSGRELLHNNINPFHSQINQKGSIQFLSNCLNNGIFGSLWLTNNMLIPTFVRELPLIRFSPPPSSLTKVFFPSSLTTEQPQGASWGPFCLCPFILSGYCCDSVVVIGRTDLSSLPHNFNTQGIFKLIFIRSSAQVTH